MSNLKESLYEANSLIYQVQNKCYCIGMNTFTELTDSAASDIYDLLQNAVKKQNDRQIEKYLEKMLRMTTSYRVDSKEYLRTRDKLFAFIDELEENDQAEYASLQRQYVDYMDMLEKYHTERQ